MQAAAANPFMGMGDLAQPISASPARPPPPSIPPKPKSAFDDLEEVMRMSQPMMFGSPARQPMMPMGATGSIF